MRLTRQIAVRTVGLLTVAATFAGALVWHGHTVFADTTPPPAPANFRLSPGSVTADGTVVLTWDAPSAADVTHYEVYRYPGAALIPTADALTYLGRTENANTYYIDTAPTEGSYHYAVRAVDAAGNAGPLTTWVAITADFPANGTGTITPDSTAPGAPAGLSTGAAYSKTRRVTLTWTASNAPDLWRYLIYRSNGAETKMVAYAEAGTASYAETLTQDGAYTYYIIAQDKTGNASPASGTAAITVDGTSPAVQITAPVAGQSYSPGTALTIAATITENGSGYDPSGVKYYLDGVQLTSPTLPQLASGSHTVKVEVTDRAGNTGSAESTFTVAAAPDTAAPQNLTAPAYRKERNVTLTWQPPLTNAVTQYRVYRTPAGGTATAVGTTPHNVTQFTDTVAADGVYSYHVVAENGTAAGAASAPVTVTVDTVAPTVSIRSPKDGETYRQKGSLSVAVSVADALSGKDPASVRLFLDGAPLSVSTIDLARLTPGAHSLKAEAADRAGNTASQAVSFTVKARTQDDDDDDDDDDEDRDDARQDLIDLLQDLREEIHHGIYKALLKKAENGSIREFVKLVQNQAGKHISPSAAKKLLKAAGERDGDDDDHDGEKKARKHEHKQRGRSHR